MANSVSLIFSSAERICKRAKVDFLRRRVSILVTFRFQSLRLLTTHCSWQHRNRKIICQRRNVFLPGRKILHRGRKIILGKFCAVKKSYEPGRNTSREENIGGNSFPGRKVICWGKIVWKGPQKDFFLENQHLSGLLTNSLKLISCKEILFMESSNKLALIQKDCVFHLLLSAVGPRVSGAGARPSPNQTKQSFWAKPKFPEIEAKNRPQNSKWAPFLLQVKIWFQNHRYKHKRQAKEKAMTETPGGSGSSPRRWALCVY